MRPVFSILFPLLLCAVFAAAVTPAQSLAQVLRGQVIAAEDSRGMRGVFVVLVDSNGVDRSASLSDLDGRFRIQAPHPGPYRIRWELVGRPIDISEEIVLGAGTETSIRIVSFSRPQLLGTVEVSAAPACPVDPDAEQIAGLWVEVAKVLRVTEWSVRDERLRFDVEALRREWDESYERIKGETRNIHEGMIGRPFATMGPDFLAENGYMVASDDGKQHYFAPDEKSLLHDSFLAHHCLSLEKSPEGLESLVGISFYPAPNRNRPDISGTFWLNRDSLLLRAIDYRHVGLDRFAMHPILGGRMEFDKVASGEWYIARWSMRVPEVTLCRGTGLFGFLSPRDRPCLDGILEVAGEVLDVRLQPIRRAGVDTLRTAYAIPPPADPEPDFVGSGASIALSPWAHPATVAPAEVPAIHSRRKRSR